MQPSAIAGKSDKQNQEQQGKLQQVDEGEEGDDVVHMWKIKRKGWGNRARVVSGGGGGLRRKFRYVLAGHAARNERSFTA